MNKNVKAQRSLPKLCALYYKYIYEKTAKIHCKLLFNSGVIILQISMTKYLSFQHNFSAITDPGVAFADVINVNRKHDILRKRSL